MLSITVTCCKNVQIFIFSLLKMTFLQLLSKFQGYTFNGSGKNEFENLNLKLPVVAPA